MTVSNDSTIFKQCSHKERCVQMGQQGWLPATREYFNGDKRHKDGLSSACKGCHCEANRCYRQEHPEQAGEAQRRWREKHPEQKRETARHYREKHPEQHATKERTRRARKRASPGTHTAADIAAQVKRQRGKCYYCGVKLTKVYGKPNSATVDHVVPLDRGGRNSPDNLVIACAHCNFSKNNKRPHEWAEGGRLL
jgi:5-methylcytosine-specific restriction endonuclease McrA